MNEELLMEVLSQSRKKYGCVSEIGRMTKELAEALSRNDKVSAQLLLEMRGEEMAKADTCEKNIRLLVEEAGIQDREPVSYTHLIMLPSAENVSGDNVYKFADSGIREMLRKMQAFGGMKVRYVCKIAGGAKMFEMQGSLGNIGQRLSLIHIWMLLSVTPHILLWP